MTTKKRIIIKGEIKETQVSVKSNRSSLEANFNCKEFEPELADFMTHSPHLTRHLEPDKSVADEVKSLGARGEDLPLITDEMILPPGVKFGQSIDAAVSFAAQEKQRKMTSGAN